MHQPRRPGCLSPLAISSMIFTLVILAILEVLTGNAMFSPGALNAQAGAALGGVTSHAEIGGNCALCHATPWSALTMADLCLSCHENIRADAGDAATLHGALGQNVPLVCRDCHSEHRGAAAGLTVMEAVSFPHEVTGFILSGHTTHPDSTPFTCVDCHTERISSFSQQTCLDCHRSLDPLISDSHLQAFGSGCLDCHDGQDRFAGFDHSQTKFALTGTHLAVPCAQCHIFARSITDLQNTDTACESCHLADDAHSGQYGVQCGSCHKPTDWNDASFDHNLAAFALDGAHLQVACADCHKGSVFKGTPQECAACHSTPAFHAGMFDDQVCSICHTTTAWRPARFEGAHPFPLSHGGLNNSCADCHQPDLTQWTCYPCHNQVEIARKHQEEGIPDFVDCLRCHPTGGKDEAEGKDD